MRADDGRIVPTFFRQALAGEPITVNGDGRQTRSLCHVDDTVDALVALAKSDCTGPVNIGNPHELTVLQIADVILDLAGSSPPVHSVAANEDDPRRRCPDIRLAGEQLGWRPRVPYRDGLAMTLDWFRAQLDKNTTTSGVLQGS